MTPQAPFDDPEIHYRAAGCLSFLLSVIRSGERLSGDEEAAVIRVIHDLQGAGKER